MTATIQPSEWGYSLRDGDGELIASCDLAHLPGTIQWARGDGADEMAMHDLKVYMRAKDVREGMLVDLAGDKYADPDNDPDSLLVYELAEVIEMERETRECVRIDFDKTSVGFPSGHLLNVDPESIVKAAQDAQEAGA